LQFAICNFLIPRFTLPDMLKYLSIAALAVSTTAQAQSLPPVRPIGATVARSTEPMGAATTAVALPGGKVLVNDALKRRVLLLDSTFTQVTVVADSTSSTANAYGNRPGGLLSYRGDSALFVDPASLSMLVISSEGKITRVMSAPRPQDVGFLVGGPNGLPGFDAKGKLVYRAQPAFRIGAPARGAGGGGGGSTTMMPEFPDSVPVVRFDLAARSLDTAGFFKVNRPNMSITQTASGGFSMTSKINPIPTVDDWALLSDGTIAFVKGADYSINWVDPDGSKRTTGKVPYEWQRLDDDSKAALLDSARKAFEEASKRMQAGGGPMVMMGGGGGAEVVTRMAVTGAAAGSPPSRGSSEGRGAAPGGARIEMPPVTMVNADELPDYRPAFTAGSARGDLDGNLWVRTTSPVGNAGPIYFVINKKGEVIDRVQLPEGRQIAGFGKNGDVFLAVRDAEGNARVERAKIK
jgi:hypothetical protein